MEQSTKGNGKMIYSMVKEMKSGKMDQHIQECTKKEGKMGKELMLGQMDHAIKEIGMRIK